MVVNYFIRLNRFAVALFLPLFCLMSLPALATSVLYDQPAGLAANLKAVVNTVKVDNKGCGVYRTKVTASENFGIGYAEYAHFSMSGSVTVTVTPNYTVQNVVVLPSRKGITPRLSGNTITFTITQPGQYFVKINGNPLNGNTAPNPLYIFASPLETNVPSPTSPNVVYFGPGIYTSPITVQSGKTYYFAGGAVYYGQLVGENVNNVTIRGRGIICGEKLNNGNWWGRDILFINSSNINIEGVNVMDAFYWSVEIRQCNTVTIDNIQVINEGASSDGCDIQSSSNVTVKNSFFRGHDDILAVKSHYAGWPCSKVTFQDCVVWCDSSNPMTIGYDITANVTDITYKRIDVLSMSMPPVYGLEAVMAIEPHDGGSVSGVYYEDIIVDLQCPQNSLFRFSTDGGAGTINGVTVDNVFVHYGGTLGGIIQGVSAGVSNIQFLGVAAGETGKKLSSSDNIIGSNVSGVTVGATPLVPPPYRPAPIQVGTAPPARQGAVFDFENDYSGGSLVQNRSGWFYQYRNQATRQLFSNMPITDGMWKISTYCWINPSIDWVPGFPSRPGTYWRRTARMCPEGDLEPVLTWIAPNAGTAYVSGSAKKGAAGGDGVIIKIIKDLAGAGDTTLFTRTVGASDTSNQTYGTLSVPVVAGSRISFNLSKIGNNANDVVNWNPIIELR